MPDAFLLLRRVHLFTGLKDDQLREIAAKFHYEEHDKDVAIFHQGDGSEAFYMIEHGKVVVVRFKGTEEQTVAHLSDGDYFGEMALIHNRRRSASVQTVIQTGLWRLDASDFFEILGQYPQIRANLDVVIETRQANRRKSFPWLEDDEVVYLIAGKHFTLFWLSELPGILGFILALVAAYAGFHYLNSVLFLYLFIPVAVLAVGWMIWNYIDWDNDLYIVTNRRVIDYEKIVLLYDSRNEAPLSTCRNVNVATDEWGRIFGYGDVIINTFSGNIAFHHIPNPRPTADLIQEQLNRQRIRTARADRQTLKRTLRQSMGLEVPPASGKTTPVMPIKKEVFTLPNPLTQALGHFSFKVRTETGGTVTYHKHPVVLLQNLGLPTLLGIGLLALLVMRMIGTITLLEGPAFFVAWLIPFLAVVAWWLYQYEDWRNDIYQVAPDQILDISRKPLGQELRKTAPLGNVLSIKTDRPGLLALMLNYGSVIIQTGPGGEMRFEDVFAPLDVQQDIFRRMELRQHKAAADQVAAERDRLSKVLGAFYEITLDEQRDRLNQRVRALKEEIGQIESHMKDLVDQMAVIEGAIEQAPLDRLDALAVARLNAGRERAGEEFTAADLRRGTLNTELQNVEREIRQLDQTVAMVQ